MKICNVSLTRFVFIFFAALVFFLLAGCSAEKKKLEALKRLDEAEAQVRQMQQARQSSEAGMQTLPIVHSGFTTFLSENDHLHAVINENNVPLYSKHENGYEVVDYLHRGDVISVSEEANRGAPDMYELSYSKELVHKKYLGFITLPKDKTTMLTNGEEVDHEVFPLREADIADFIGREGEDIPHYLESVDDWVTRNGGGWDWRSSCLSIRLKNLPQKFDVLIYAPDESDCLRFTGEKEEFPIEMYKDFFDEVLDEKSKNILAQVLPFYVFYYSAPLTAVSGKQKTEIRSRDNDLIFSTYIDYPAAPFRVVELGGKNFYLQHCTDTPFYLVIYQTVFEPNLHPLDFKRVPVKAFTAYPKNGIWKDLLTLGPEFSNNGEYFIYLYRLDKNKPEDYTQQVYKYQYSRLGSYRTW